MYLHEKELMQEYKETLLAIINTYLPHAVVYLFGSRARRDNREGSDIDIALDVGAAIDDEIMVRICSDFCRSVSYKKIVSKDLNEVARMNL